MTERAIELLNLSEESSNLLLDIGCGSGISGEVLSDNEHYWIGFDISRHMLSEYFIFVHIIFNIYVPKNSISIFCFCSHYIGI